MSEWKTYKLGDIAELRKEQIAPNGKEQPYIGLEHIEQQTLRLAGIGSSTDVLSNKFKFYSGDILYGKLRPYFRKVYHPKFEGVCSTDIYVIKNKENIDKSFLYYLVATEDFTRIAYSGSTGTHMPRADWNQLVETEWNIPYTIEEQQRIASILSSLDDKIELNRQTNQTLETLAQTLFQEMCVPKGEELPEGWRVEKLGEVCEVNKNSLNKKLDSHEWIDYIEISEVNKGIIGNVTRYHLGEEPSRAKRKLKHGDTVLSTVRPDRGSYFLAIYPPITNIVSTGFAVFSATKVPYTFLYIFLTNETSLTYYGQVANGGAYPAINPNVIMDMDLIIPKETILNEFNKFVEPMFLQYYTNEQETQTLIALRDSLLPKLMKGEI